MLFIDKNLPTSTSRLPQLAGRITGLTSNLHRKLHSQAKERDIVILALLASLGRTAMHACRAMGERDGCLDLIAMLPTWATGSIVRNITITEQLLGIEHCRMRAKSGLIDRIHQ